jgi:hypothetical protein
LRNILAWFLGGPFRRASRVRDMELFGYEDSRLAYDLRRGLMQEVRSVPSLRHRLRRARRRRSRPPRLRCRRHRDEESRATFLRSLRDRGLAGVKLAITDAHGGLIKAVQTVLVGASWQRCKVHFTRNVTAHAPEAYKKKLAGALQGIFNQPDAEAALVAYAALREQFGAICGKAMQFWRTDSAIR